MMKGIDAVAAVKDGKLHLQPLSDAFWNHLGLDRSAKEAEGELVFYYEASLSDDLKNQFHDEGFKVEWRDQVWAASP